MTRPTLVTVRIETLDTAYHALFLFVLYSVLSEGWGRTLVGVAAFTFMILFGVKVRQDAHEQQKTEETTE